MEHFTLYSLLLIKLMVVQQVSVQSKRLRADQSLVTKVIDIQTVYSFTTDCVLLSCNVNYEIWINIIIIIIFEHSISRENKPPLS